MSEDNKGRIREFIDRVLTAGEIDATGDYFHEHVVEEVPLPGKVRGFTGSKRPLPGFEMHFRIRNGASRNKLRRETKSLPALSGQARIRESS